MVYFAPSLYLGDSFAKHILTLKKPVLIPVDLRQGVSSDSEQQGA